MGDILYELNQVRHYYGDKQVLDIEALKIPKGSILGLSGPNGSGKSTLLKILAFAMAPSQGQVKFNNRKERPMSPGIRSKVTLLTQKPYLLKRTVFDNVIYGLKIRKDKDNLHQRAAHALERVGLNYDDFHHRFWDELSGGEAQRVAMAARLILHPMALLLDEPVANVDTKSATLIRKAAMSAKKSWGCTLVIVSHDLSWLHQCSDTKISMAEGRIFSTGEESMIPRPYTLLQDSGSAHPKDRVLVKDLGKNAFIRLSPKTGKTAVIPKEKIKLCLSKENNNGYDNQIRASITQMLLEQKNNNILTTIQVDSFSLTLSLSHDQVKAQSLFPGKQIILMFRARDIAWR
ncbi:MAG: ATP-binding cassette domain-containing protein [Desulfobacter sp.]|nr:ATP-binding cassette domain-containing protein [Desulfobacter sp.]